MKDNYSKLKALLQEMFQMDQADLDFGIYRIMNQKRAEVEEFLDKDLLPQVKEAFAEYTSVDRLRIEEQLKNLRKTLEDAGVEPETSPKYKELQQELSDSVDIEALEQEVYSNLVSFFSRYYDNGDFMSRPRYKDGTYAIPYKGEEVKLHWANADQYYIKTTEYFRDYTFVLPSGQKVHFKIIDASTEQDNNKEESGKERRFILCEDKPVCEENGELIFHFHYKINPGKQAKLNEAAVDFIKENADKDPIKKYIEIFAPAPTESNPARTLIEKHINDYTARNTFDYFIHKDLGGFLRRELDFYIKNEILFIDDIENRPPLYFQQSMSKVKVIKKIALKIIAFLEQLENFQKRLWLKKKFVVETNYCITLDRIPEELYREIIANKEQIEEWKRLFVIEEMEGYKEPLTNKFLKDNPFLVLDTAFFAQEFKDKLLASIEDIEEKMDGLLIHSENFQALNLLQERYREQIKCIYIDPPYNTVHSEILYKNQFKHSSWLSLIANTTRMLPAFWKDNFSFGLAIDDFELINLVSLLDSLFPKLDRNIVVVNHHPQGAGGRLSRTHEYYILLSNPDAPSYLGAPLDDYQEDRNFMRSGTAENNFRYGRWKSFYALLLDPKTNRIVDAEEPVPLGEKYPTENTNEGHIRLYPINSNGEERVWRSSYSTGKFRANNGELTVSDRGTVYQTIEHEKKREVLFSNWTDSKYNSGVSGAGLIKEMGFGGLFDYPKSIYTLETGLWAQTYAESDTIILDYFAGSGTTAHAVINLNRKDQGKRKYIMVEMGEYFDTVLKPRIQKVIYSTDWKDGKPLSREGSSHMFKYIRLESYEDTLNNLELKRTEIQQQTLGENAEIREPYILSYMLDIESQGSNSLFNLDQFEDPFNYKLKINRNGENKINTVDLVETFNYLLGLKVQQTEFIREFKVVRGELLNGERVLIIWRNLQEKSNEDLDKFFDKQGYNTLDFEFDRVYVNGDNNLQNIKKDEERWKVFLIEQEFMRLMFDVQDI